MSKGLNKTTKRSNTQCHDLSVLFILGYTLRSGYLMPRDFYELSCFKPVLTM